MKKFMVFLGKLLLSASAAVGLGAIGMAWEWRFEVILCAFFFGGIFIALILGVFDIEDDAPDSKHLSVKDAARSMRPAA